jgi:hypothetical protein
LNPVASFFFVEVEVLEAGPEDVALGVLVADDVPAIYCSRQLFILSPFPLPSSRNEKKKLNTYMKGRRSTRSGQG